MKVVYYQRNAPSGFHIHAGSYASCFFIPDKKVVLYADQAGSFGAMRYSYTDTEVMIHEAEMLCRGVTPETEGVGFSKIVMFEYDTKQLEVLVEQARTHADLDVLVMKGISALQEQVKPKETIIAIDPATVDEARKKRLEELVERHVTNPNFRSIYYRLLGSEMVQEKNTQNIEEELRRRLEELRGERSFGRDMFGSYIRQAQRAGLGEVAKEFAMLVYTAEKHGVSYDDRLCAAEILGKPAEEIIAIKKERLLNDMLSNWGKETDYFKVIQKASTGIPFEHVVETARRAYELLLIPSKSELRSGMEPIRATQLAKAYLTEEQFQDAGKKLVQHFLERDRVYAIAYENCGWTIEELELPHNIVRPLMFRFFERTLFYKPTQAESIAQKYQFTEEEMRPAVTMADREMITFGRLDIVYEIRERYGHLVEDQSFPTADVQLLVGMGKF